MYAIYSTPGLLQDGSYMLSADAIRRGEVERGYVDGNGPAVAVYHSEAAAETAMMALVPAGSSPSIYAGLSVGAATALARAYPELCEWMD